MLQKPAIDYSNIKITPSVHAKLNQLQATAICGNDISSSCLYVPEALIKDIEVLDRAYPEIPIEFVEVEGKFGPDIIEELSKKWKIPKKFMWIGSPGNKFPYRVSEPGVVRLIM